MGIRLVAFLLLCPQRLLTCLIKCFSCLDIAQRTKKCSNPLWIGYRIDFRLALLSRQDWFLPPENHHADEYTPMWSCQRMSVYSKKWCIWQEILVLNKRLGRLPNTELTLDQILQFTRTHLTWYLCFPSSLTIRQRKDNNETGDREHTVACQMCNIIK